MATYIMLSTLTDEAARITGGKGDFAIITASLSAANQNEWIKYIRERLAEKYPEMKLVTIQPSEGDRDRAFSETQNVLKVYPNVKMGPPGGPGALVAAVFTRIVAPMLTLALFLTITVGFAEHALGPGDSITFADFGVEAPNLGFVSVEPEGFVEADDQGVDLRISAVAPSSAPAARTSATCRASTIATSGWLR